jgi:hypothetical protein
MNAPDIEPPARVHTELVTNPLGLDVIVQPVSADAKFVPVRMTLVPARPEVGNIVIAARTVKVAVALSKFFGPGRP